MAVADLLVVIIRVILEKVNPFKLHIVFNFSPYACNSREVIASTVVSISVWLTVAFTFDRMVAICFQKLKMKYCTEKTAATVIITVCLLSLFNKIPVFFKYNRYSCRVSYAYYYYPVWMVFDWTDRILTPVLPFVLILLFNTLTVRHILMASAVRRKLRGQRNGDEKNDPEMKNRRRSIVLLFTITGSFVLLWVTHVVYLSIQRISGMYQLWTTPQLVIDKMGRMLQLSSSCTNTFIYVITQRKFREEVMNAVKYPFTVILKFIK
ncbi:probable G-protein coupled receptor 139 [Scyliorhinus canicula]|uniref:probable G-protein coupled receptor 139 n=1 Tax=Scyliorhinus canicula TaxID=7830 RepID=UPI0018F2E113|nr:probable G-protein coupled receptor 139 [Scyliorhinus canicula]